MNVKVGLKESWMPKNWCFWNVVLEKTLESLLDCKEIQPVHPKEISPECSLKGLMLKLKGQYFGHLMWRADSVEKTLMLGQIEGRRRGGYRGWDGWMVSPIQWTWVWVNSRSWWWTKRPSCCGSWGRKEWDMTEQLNWTDEVKFLWGYIWKHICAKESRAISIELIYFSLTHDVGSTWKGLWNYSFLNTKVNFNIKKKNHLNCQWSKVWECRYWQSHLIESDFFLWVANVL